MKKNFLLWIITFVVCFSNFTTMAREVETKKYSNVNIEESFSDEQIIVVLNKTASQKASSYDINSFRSIHCQQISVIYDSYNINEKNNSSNNTILLLKLEEKGKNNVLKAIKELENMEDILYVGPDYHIFAGDIQFQNDNYTVIENRASQWPLNKISLEDAWDITTGSSNTKIGILDTGIDGNHPDLIGNVLNNLSRDFTTGTEIIVGTPTDMNGHGTMVAGIIGANGNNNIGIKGVNWNAKMVSLKIFNDQGVGTASSAILAINYANQNQIPLLNLSGGFRSSDENITGLEYAISNYYGLVICAAGNDDRDLDGTSSSTRVHFYPASFGLSNIITVGGSAFNDGKTTTSNYGEVSVDLFAPGAGVTSTWPTALISSGLNNSITGTSVATPFVTGAASLILSLHSGVSRNKIKNIILGEVDIISSLSSYCSTGGRLNVSKIVRSDLLHNYYYTNIDILEHKCICNCGYELNKKHVWVLSNPNGGSLSLYVCSYCGATTTFIPVEPTCSDNLLDELI